MSKIGFIGGSGLDDLNILERSSTVSIQTPYGDTSSTIKKGEISGQKVAILARHGVHHSISPSNINYRSNIWALKEVGCSHILATTAVGSLREKIKPGDIVFPDQFIDHTKKRLSTFFDGNEIIHTPMDEPFSSELIRLLESTASELEIRHHSRKTVITIEGPRVSSKSESHMFRSWGADVVNMSSCPEVILAKELNIEYATLAMATDYDCWKENEEPVTWDMVQKTMKNNADNVISILINAVSKIKTFN